MRIALFVKDTLIRESIVSMFAADGRVDVVGASGVLGTAITSANVHKARVFVFQSDNVSEDEIAKLREFSDVSPAEMLAFGSSETLADSQNIPFDKFASLDTPKLKFIKMIFELGSKEEMPRILVREKKPIYGMVTVLTSREHDIALKLAEGLNNKQISQELELAEQTVKNLVSVILRKMGCSNRTQVALKLSQSGRDQ